MLSAALAAMLVGCGGLREASDVWTGCAVEIDVQRNASEAAIEAVRKRVQAIPAVARVVVVSPREHVRWLLRELRREGYRGRAYEQLAARFEKYMGGVVVGTPRHHRRVTGPDLGDRRSARARLVPFLGSGADHDVGHQPGRL